MTALFADSFDHYDATRILLKYTNSKFAGSAIGSAYGRLGGSGIGLLASGATPDYVERVIANTATLVIGFAFRWTLAAWMPGAILSLLDTGTEQISVQTTALGRFRIYRGATMLAESVGSYSPNVWYYLELKVTFATGATGAVDLHLDGASIASAASVVTAVSANAYANQVRLQGIVNGGTNHDDFYICDNAGTVNNDFLGDVRVQALLPNGAGTTTQWGLVGAATNWQATSNNPPDDDTSYVSSSTIGQIDTYAMADLVPTSGAVKFVQTVIDARKDDAGTRTIARVQHIGVTDYVGPNLDVPSSYSFLRTIDEVSPATAAAYTVAEVNGLESGQKLIA